MSTNWIEMDHVVPKGYDRFVTMLAEACGADNEYKLITRFQKTVVAIKKESEENVLKAVTEWGGKDLADVVREKIAEQ